MRSTIKKYFFEVPALSKKLRPAGIISGILLVSQMWWFLLSRKLLFVERKMNFRLCHNGYHFSVNIYNNYDFLTFRTLHLRNDYEIDNLEDIEVIVDAGANVGFMTLILRATYPNAKIFALEPVKETFERLKENVAFDENIIPMPVGLSDIDGEQTFDVNPLLSFGSSISERGEGFNKETVDVITLESLYKKINFDEVDLFKFDIEGAEESVFVDSKLIAKACNYVGEVHGDLISVSVNDFLDRFSKFEVKKQPLGKHRAVFSAFS